MSTKSKSGRVGSDIDGTYLEHEELHGHVDCLITANTYEEYDEVMDDLDWEDIPVFWNPLGKDEKPDIDSIVNHKSNIINKLELDTFFEDQPLQKEMLTVLCTKCNVILVKEGEKAI